MQFSIMTVFALAAVAIAMPTGMSPSAHHPKQLRSGNQINQILTPAYIGMVKRDVVDNAIPAEAPAMTDASGRVVPFSAKGVNVAASK